MPKIRAAKSVTLGGVSFTEVGGVITECFTTVGVNWEGVVAHEVFDIWGVLTPAQKAAIQTFWANVKVAVIAHYLG